jgi:hypothetical protein
MSGVLEWVKTNVFTVVFLAVMVAALVALPIIASSLNAKIADDLQERNRKLSELESLERTNVSISFVNGPTIQQSTLVNQNLLERYKEVTEAQAEDAEEVREAAIEHNRWGRGVLNDELFPDPPPARREVLPKLFNQQIIDAHEALLKSVNAGSPPKVESIKEDIERRRRQFYSSTLQKDLEDELTADERERLRNELSQARTSFYQDAAERIGFYADTAALRLPDWDQSRQYSMAELFEWQWQYWINQDILTAIAKANEGSSSVLRAPVKHLISVTIWPREVGLGGEDGSGTGSLGRPPGPSSGSAGFGSAPPARRGSTNTGPNAGSGAGPAARPVDPKQEIKPDYTVSFTGRRSNPLYDVRLVSLDVVVDATRIPALMDALAQQNFMTVLDMRVTPADPWQAARSGYLYGSDPVARLEILLETVWLRSWTAPYMPLQVKVALGVPQAPTTPPPSG